MLGIEIVAPYDTCPIRINKELGGFFIQAFQLNHEDTPCYGILVRHKGNHETFLYATDTEYIRYNFNACKVNHFMVEVNYQAKYVDFDAPNYSHKLKGHQSLETCIKFLKENVNESTKSVIPIHLGVGSTDFCEIKQEIQSVVGENVLVSIATKGKVIEV